MEAKNLDAISIEDLKVEYLKRGFKLKGEHQGDIKMVEAAVGEFAKRTPNDRKDLIKEGFWRSEELRTETEAPLNNTIGLRKAVLALAKKLLVEEDEKKKRIMLSKSPEAKSSGPGVIVKSEPDPSSRTLQEKNPKKNVAKVLFPQISPSSSIYLPYSCLPPIPPTPTIPVNTHVTNISTSSVVFTSSPTRKSSFYLTNSPRYRPHNSVIKFHDPQSGVQQSKKVEKDQDRDDKKAKSKRDRSEDPWLENLHKGLDKIFFPNGCEL